MKRAALTKGAIKRLRYTDRYVHSFRAEIIEQCLTSDSGGKPLFRSRGYDRENRRKKKLMDREEGGSSNIVGSVPPTLGGQLAAGLQRIVTEEGN